MLSYKKQKEALLKEAQQHREVVKDGIAPIVSASQSKGKKVLLVAGGAALAYGLANWYFQNKNASSEEEEEESNAKETNTAFSFVDMMKQEAATLLTTFVKEQMSHFLQQRNS